MVQKPAASPAAQPLRGHLEADLPPPPRVRLQANSLAEAREMVASNPFHRRGIRVATVRPWLEKILE